MFEFVLVLQGECDKYYGLEFVFEIYVKELIVGDIYVRIYNEQFIFFLEVSICICNYKEIQFDLLCMLIMMFLYFFQNSKGFIIDLLDFMGFQVQYFYFLMMLNQNSGQQAGQSVRLKQVEMVLEGLRNVIRNNLGECQINILGKYC